MTHTSATPAPAATTQTPTTLRGLRVLAALAVANLVWQFVTAGELFPRGGPLALHSWGAVVLHVLTGLTALAAGAHARATRGPRWPAVLAAVVFVLSFVQAYYGDRSTLYVHIPGAIVLTIGSVWVLAWAFTPAARRTP